MRIDINQAKKILVSELGYDPIEADLFLKDYPAIHNELVESVNSWLANRTVLDVRVHGISIQEIMKTQRYHFLLALREINRLLDQDITPEKRERIVQQLKRPVPRW